MLVALLVVSSRVVCLPALASESDRQWSVGSADCSYRVLSHRIVDVKSRDGASVTKLNPPLASAPSEAGLDSQPPEQIEIKAGHGTYVYATHPIAPARVADELSLKVVVWADRPGIQILARVVLPRSVDPANEKPFTVLLPGEIYRHTGTWQVLAVENIAAALEERIRVLRSQVDTPIDAREAFVDVVALNIYGGNGITTTSIHTLHVDRILVEQTASSNAHPVSFPRTEGVGRPTGQPGGVSLEGDMLHAADRPLFARMIDCQGESFEFLAQLGFNVIHLSQTATMEQLNAAEALGLWVVCPPPDHSTPLQLHANFQRVLAWDIGHHLGTSDIDSIRNTVTALREMKLLANRPVLGSADTSLASYGRWLNILVHNRELVGTSFSLEAYAHWLRQRRQLAVPGCCHWASIQTEPIQELMEQATAIHGALGIEVSETSGTLEVEQIRSLSLAAIGQGVRGLYFRSRRRLDEQSASALHRSHTLKLLNLELEQISPWVAGGRPDETVDSQPDSTVSIRTLRTSRSSLAIISRHNSTDQLVSSPGLQERLRVVIPSASIAAQVFELTASGPRPSVCQRTVGGMQIELEPYRNDTMVVVTQDPLAAERLSRDGEQRVVEVATLSHYLAATEMEQAADVIEHLQLSRPVPEDVIRAKNRADDAIRRTAKMIHDGDYFSAEQTAREAVAYTSACRHAIWLSIAQSLPVPAASPLACSFTELPYHLRLAPYLSRAHNAMNLIAGGECEALEPFTASAWECREHPAAGLHAEVRIDDTDARSGQGSLLLRAWSEDSNSSHTILESPPVWINSPPLRVQAGQLVMIHGWAKVPRPLSGNVDGLMIFDSLAGPSLGIRLPQTTGWQEFQLFRLVDATQEITVTFALPGLGEARLDQLSVRALDMPSRVARHERRPAIIK
jgi:hypothetical protein